MSTAAAFSQYARRFFSGTLLSRISGMGRDLAMAFAFGDHPTLAAFMVAFRLSNLFRRLLGEGPFQSVFIPHYEGLRVQSPTQAAYFFRKLSMLLVFVLLLITVLAEAGIWFSCSYLNLTEGNREILILSGWMFPGLLFICLYGLNISLLNCHDSFFVPSVAPIISNLIWIGGAIALQSQEISSAMLTLSKLVVIGFAGQWLVTLPLAMRHVSASLKEWLSFTIPTEVKQLAKSFSYGIIGVGAIQFNALADSLFARHADLRGPVYLWYSIRLEQLVLAIFGIACVSTIVPRLSRAIKSLDMASAQSYFSLSFRRILAVMIPCTLALFVLGTVSVNILYGRGHFMGSAIYQTTLCLWAYTIGLIPTTLVILFSALFYARKDFKTPMYISVAVVILSILLNALFVFALGLGAMSTALSTSICAWINYIVLQKLAHKQGWNPHFPLSRINHICFAGLFAMICAIGADYFLLNGSLFTQLVAEEFPRKLSEQLLQFAIPSLSFLIGLSLYAKLTKNQDLLELFTIFFPQKEEGEPS